MEDSPVKILNLLPPLSLEDKERWKRRIIASSDVLLLIRGHLNKRLEKINAQLDDTDKLYSLPGHDKKIAALLETRAELKILRELTDVDNKDSV